MINKPSESSGGMPDPTSRPELNFLDHYFASIYNKLEADALLFNKKLPHAGLMGAENENAIARVIRDFLPPKYGVEVNALVIDRFGKVSKQADIVIYNADSQPSFFRKVYPVEIVYAVIEVKTSMSATEAKSALDNLESVSRLEFRPALTPFWETRTNQESIHHSPPALYVFAFRTDCNSFETFARWIDWQYLHRGVTLRDKAPTHPEIRVIRVCALDQGLISMESTNGYVQRWIAVADAPGVTRSFETTVEQNTVQVDPAKSLFLFLQRLWFDLQYHPMHPGFDIRSYLSSSLDAIIEVSDAQIYKTPGH